MAKRDTDQPDTQQRDPGRDMNDTRDQGGAGRGDEEIRGIAEDEDEDDFDEADDMDEEDEEQDDEA